MFAKVKKSVCYNACVERSEGTMRFTGFDPNGIARVYAEHKNTDVAETMCHEEARDYVQRRRDTGPLSQWTFTHDERRM
jgi:hypothetical protein